MGSPLSSSIMKSLLALLALIVCVSSLVLPQEKVDNELLCSICVDMGTDLDEFITDDKTEQQIVEFVEQICHALGAISKDLEIYKSYIFYTSDSLQPKATCIALVESQLPAIIDGLVNDQLNPQEVCDFIKACP